MPDVTGMDEFEILGQVSEIEIIAIGRSIRILERLQRLYGRGRWRKLKGVATVRYSDGTVDIAEVHWYEANGIGQERPQDKAHLVKEKA